MDKIFENLVKHRDKWLFVVSLCLLVLFIQAVVHKSIYVQEAEDRISALEQALEQRQDKIDKLRTKVEDCEQQISKLATAKGFIESRKDLLIDWVYKHSRHTSRQDCGEIVDSALKTDYPFLLLSIMSPESGYNPAAVSSRNAVGICQIRATFQQVKALKKAEIINESRDLFDIPRNVAAGEHFLKEKLRLARGNIRQALVLYRSGHSQEQAQQEYNQRILNNFRKLQTILLTDDITKDQEGCYVKRIKDGDTLNEISEDVYGRTSPEILARIARVNGIGDVDRIKAGDTLRLPKI